MPLGYRGIKLVPKPGIEPECAVLQTAALPLSYFGVHKYLLKDSVCFVLLPGPQIPIPIPFKCNDSATIAGNKISFSMRVFKSHQTLRNFSVSRTTHGSFLQLINWRLQRGSIPRPSARQADVLPLNYGAINIGIW